MELGGYSLTMEGHLIFKAQGLLGLDAQGFWLGQSELSKFWKVLFLLKKKKICVAAI